eukprot:m.172722 g.172722  ORF g.172722 m.172722 type:complete len:196 (+) comp31698_c7_seq2:788-1375(+)
MFSRSPEDDVEVAAEELVLVFVFGSVPSPWFKACNSPRHCVLNPWKNESNMSADGAPRYKESVAEAPVRKRGLSAVVVSSFSILRGLFLDSSLSGSSKAFDFQVPSLLSSISTASGWESKITFFSQLSIRRLSSGVCRLQIGQSQAVLRAFICKYYSNSQRPMHTTTHQHKNSSTHMSTSTKCTHQHGYVNLHPP